MVGFICCYRPIDDLLLVSMRVLKSQPTDHPDHHETNQNNDNTFEYPRCLPTDSWNDSRGDERSESDR